MNHKPHTHPHSARSPRLASGLFAGLLLLLAACGGAPAADPSTSGGDSPTSAPAAGPATIGIPTFEFVQPTVTLAVTARPESTVEATDEADAERMAVALDPQAVERGRGRYEALECGSCHGDAGEGTDEGSSLLTFAMAEDDFISFMRSGGELGADHQYSTNRLSASGGANLYQYLLSLAQESS